MKIQAFQIILLSVIFAGNGLGQEVKTNEVPTFAPDGLKAVIERSAYVALFQLEDQNASELKPLKGRIEQASSLEQIKRLLLEFAKPARLADSVVQVIFIEDKANRGYLIIKVDDNERLFLRNKETEKLFEFSEIVKMTQSE